MKFAILILLACTAAADAPKIQWQRGPCRGGLMPNTHCKTCEHCVYCGHDKGRAANTGTCIVCAQARAAQ